MKYQSVYNRLRRIEGQIRGIEDMVAKDKAEEEILVQLEAVKSSISSTIGNLLEEMLATPTENGVVLSETHIRALLRMVKRG